MCAGCSKVLHEGIFEAVGDAKLLTEPEDSLRLGVLRLLLLALVHEVKSESKYLRSANCCVEEEGHSKARNK